MRIPDPGLGFRIAVDRARLADLRTRIACTRWPNQPAGRPWQYGASLDYMRTVADYWQKKYDWYRFEAELNRWPQYRVDIDGQPIHFILEQGSGEHPLPLVITHGWPGSVAEFLGVIDLLAHPERHGGDVRDAFTVIAPSLPGFGFSPPPAAPMHPREIARLWHRLMVDVLGCERYVAQGGDWGGIVTSWLALEFPQRLAAIHLNIVAFRPEIDEARQPLDAAEKQWQLDLARRQAGETAYQQIQGTKPQTLAYALTDSPIGLAAWILEKFQGWTLPGTDQDPPFALDHLLTNVMLYWLGGINAANWLYVHSVDGTARKLPAGRRVEVPTGLLLCPQDIGTPPPDQWIRRAYNLVHCERLERGGHFPAFEQGERFTRALRMYFHHIRH